MNMSFTMEPTPASFFTTAHRHIGDYIRFSSKQLKLHLQSAQILHVNGCILTVRIADIPVQSTIDVSANTDVLPKLVLDMGSNDNHIQYADISANATVSLVKTTPRTLSHDPATLLYNQVYTGHVTQVEITRMCASEDNTIVYMPAGRIMHVYWSAHKFEAHHVEREDVIVRYNHSPIDNMMHSPVKGDMLEILFPFALPNTPKGFLNHHIVTVDDSEPPPSDQSNDAIKTHTLLVRHDGKGFTDEVRDMFKIPRTSLPLQLRIHGKYLWYTKLSVGDNVYSDNADTKHGVIQHVLKECCARGSSQYAVKYHDQDTCVLQIRSQLACLTPKSILSSASGGDTCAFF